MQQITINFEAGLADSYENLRDLVSALIHKQGKPQKSIAADMDLSPSDLSRKLSPADDHRKFTVEDLERFMQVTGDTSPITYLAEKYLTESNRIEALEAELARLKQSKKK